MKVIDQLTINDIEFDTVLENNDWKFWDEEDEEWADEETRDYYGWLETMHEIWATKAFDLRDGGSEGLVISYIDNHGDVVTIRSENRFGGREFFGWNVKGYFGDDSIWIETVEHRNGSTETIKHYGSSGELNRSMRLNNAFFEYADFIHRHQYDKNVRFEAMITKIGDSKFFAVKAIED